MNKTFYFMAGLPRSGSTMLSSILNQNPRFYSGPSSPVLGAMFAVTVGYGGTGGAGTASTTTYNHGTEGGTSSFGSFQSWGGVGGVAAIYVPAGFQPSTFTTLPTKKFGQFDNYVDQAADVSATALGVVAYYVHAGASQDAPPSGARGGGNISYQNEASTVYGYGAKGMLEFSTNGNNLTVMRGAGAGNVSTASGANATDVFQSGNGGEGRSTNGTADDGGNGGRGAGGGGGGSVINATGTGGSGGNGGTGYVLVRSW